MVIFGLAVVLEPFRRNLIVINKTAVRPQFRRPPRVAVAIPIRLIPFIREVAVCPVHTGDPRESFLEAFQGDPPAMPSPRATPSRPQNHVTSGIECAPGATPRPKNTDRTPHRRRALRTARLLCRGCLLALLGRLRKEMQCSSTQTPFWRAPIKQHWLLRLQVRAAVALFGACRPLRSE